MRLIGLQIARLLGQCSPWAGRLAPSVCMALQYPAAPGRKSGAARIKREAAKRRNRRG